MNSRIVVTAALAFVLAGLAMPSKLSPQQQANGQLNTQQHHTPPHYRVFQLGSLGGSASSGNTINNLGWAMGSSNLTGNSSERATLWAFGLTIDLGTLGGPNSNIGWPVKNDRGVIAGVSEFSNMPDPNGEKFSCPVLLPDTGLSCSGFVWENGHMTQLPTLGGPNGFATGVNNLNQIVGWAENTIHDPTCTFPQVLQFEAVIYGPRKGQIRQLPPLSPDPDSAATAINDLGQVVGISGICGDAIGKLSAKHALLWENGKPIDIGNLGGKAFNTPMAINNRGQIAGFSDLPGDVVDDSVVNVNFHAFLWPVNGKILDLGTLEGDSISEATGINDQGQIIGTSFTAGFASSRAFIWQDGKMTDLNTLTQPNSNLYLIATGDINDRGEITGEACVLSDGVCTGQFVAFLGIPDFSGEFAEGGTAAAQTDSKSRKITIPDSIREQLQRKLGVTH
jgi:probable HAF family extracellular repeat protein